MLGEDDVANTRELRLLVAPLDPSYALSHEANLHLRLPGYDRDQHTSNRIDNVVMAVVACRDTVAARPSGVALQID
jgi:hypothetical protein